MTDLVNIVLLHAAAGQSQQLGEALEELLVHSRAEPGCAVCELNQSQLDPALWMVYERWRGQVALDLHMKQPYVAHFLGQLPSLVSESPQVQAFNYRDRA